MSNAFRSRKFRRTAAIAQLVEHLIRNEGVLGSNPGCGTKSPSKTIHIRPKANEKQWF